MNRDVMTSAVFRLLPFIMPLMFVVIGCEKSAFWHHHEAAVLSAGSSENDELWTCPMHPQIKEKAPGSCPICGMALVKMQSLATPSSEVNSSVPRGHASFNLTPERRQMIGVKTGVVERKNVFKAVEAAGRIAFDPELFTAQSEYIEALDQSARVQDTPVQEAKHSALRMVESTKLRLKVLGLSDEQILALQKQGASAPSLLGGASGEKTWIYAEVFEMDLPNLKTGLSASITGEVVGNKTVPGKVIAVDRVINPLTRTAKVRIQLLDSKVHLRPESYVDVTIHVPLGVRTIVPFDAVFDTGKEAWVYVAGEQGDFEPRLITIGQRIGREVIIDGGLKEGEKIVTSANFLIDSESRLKGVQAASVAASKEAEAPSVNLPKCPAGQFWHQEMKHCMSEPGK